MKLFIKNKIWSLGGGSSVKDENGNDVFKVKGKVISLRHTKKIYDLNGNLQYIVRNKFWNFWTRSAFILDAEKHKVCRVKNRGFKTGYDVVGFDDEISLDGWTLGGYSLVKNGEKIGTVTTNIASLADNFQLEINDTEDAGFVVALIIAIDNVRDNATKS